VRTEAFIDGSFVQAADSRTFDDISPRDGGVIAQVARGSVEDVGRAVRAARRSFEDGAWALADPAKRKRVLLRLATLIDEHADELAQLESTDVGHPIGDARRVDVPGARNCFAWCQDEVFGPVLAIQRAEDVDDAIALANGTGYGLAAAVWTSNVSTAHHVARRLRAGTVWVNTFDVSSLTTPFGGVKDTGHGRDRSLHALDAYTHLKTTWISL
jgi:acyl-CoA reductase-like NAD-dependent aldehyde dehydrogenase